MSKVSFAGCFLMMVLLLTGCGGGGTPATSGSGGTPALTISPSTTLTFPSTTVGQTSAAQTLTLTNTGTATLVLNSISAPAGNVSDFSVVTTATPCGASLAQNAFCTLSFTFTPQATGTRTATISVSDNVSGSPLTLTLTGTGAAPQVTLLPGTLTFAPTVAGSAAGAQTVTLSNPAGNATLTGIAISIGGGTGAAAFSDTTTCGATLAGGSNCLIAVNFTPSQAGPYAATLSVADSAAGSPQTVGLSGTGTAAQALLSSNSITFPATTDGTTAPAQAITLSNPGTATLNNIAITLGGTDAANFAETSTCSSTLAAGASCSISATFSPATPVGYAATISVASSATATPQTIDLSGTGSTSAVSYKLYLFPATFPETANPDASVAALYALINNAKTSVDMTMYELEDTTFSGDLVADCARGVKVRVILSSSEKSSNTPAYDQLNTAGANCSAVMSNTAFENTHQKTITVDGTTTAILSLNLQTQYYTTTRDYAMVENDAADIAAIEATFNEDYAAGTPYGGIQGASDFSYQPGAGDTSVFPAGDLIWSPTTAQADMLALINNATATLLVENEEMDASNIVSALEAACKRGVSVHIAMTNDDNEYGSEFSALEAAGCGVHVYPDNATALYIHAKVVVADYGLRTQSVYMGSINYSNASMTENRELGMYIGDPASISLIQSTVTQDYAGGTAY